MILEDFFTLSEMKDGFGTLARVKELISVMQEQKEIVVSNIHDAVRQWSTVAKILSSTENNDILKCFIELDGLHFLNCWLQEAQKPGSDSSDGSVSNFFFNMLGALNRLPLDKEILASSGIMFTLKQALCLSDVVLQEKVKKFLGRWEFLTEEIKGQGSEHGSWHVDDLKANSSKEERSQALNSVLCSSLQEKAADNECGGASMTKFSDGLDAEMHQVTSEIAIAKKMEESSSCQPAQQFSDITEGGTLISGDVNSLASSVVSNPSQESTFAAEDSLACHVLRATSTSRSSHPFDMEKVVNSHLGFSYVKASSNGKNFHEDLHNGEPNHFKSNLKEECTDASYDDLTSPMRNFVPSFNASYHALSSPTRNVVPSFNEPCTSGSRESEHSPKKSDLHIIHTITKQLPTYIKSETDQTTTFRKLDGPSEAAFHGKMSRDAKNISSAHLNTSKGVDSGHQHGYGDKFNHQAEVDLQFGDDALELAVQVAIDIEREVAEREQCYSSQEGKSSEEVVDSGSGTVRITSEEANSCASSPKMDCSSSKSSNNCTGKLGNLEIAHNVDVQELESQKSTSIVQQSPQQYKTKGFLFDLNETADSHDANNLLISSFNLSDPVDTAATTKGSFVLRAVPLIFNESCLQDSAATNASWPTLPKNITECEKTHFIHSKNALLTIDLNVSDPKEDSAQDISFEKPFHLSEQPSHNSTPRVGSKKLERLNLDLNCPGDEDDLVNSPHLGCYDQVMSERNDSECLSACSSAKHSSFRGIDLNVTPNLFDGCYTQVLSKPCMKSPSASKSSENEDSDVVILGSRVSTVKQEFNQSWQSSMRAFHFDSLMAVRPPSMVYPCMPAPGYGYQVAAMIPNATPGSYPFYPRSFGPGSYPCMVDSRGVTVPSQLLSSTGFIDAPAQRPFLGDSTGNCLELGMAGNQLERFGPSGCSMHCFDRNSGTYSSSSGIRNSGNFANSYLHDERSSIDEQMRHASRPYNFFVGTLKRNEPDSGRESHVLGYKKMLS